MKSALHLPAFLFLLSEPQFRGTQLFSPDHNFVGGTMLSEIVSLNLHAEGVGFETVSCAGPLNRLTLAVHGCADPRVPSILVRILKKVWPGCTFHGWRALGEEGIIPLCEDGPDFSVFERAQRENLKDSEALLRYLKNPSES